MNWFIRIRRLVGTRRILHGYPRRLEDRCAKVKRFFVFHRLLSGRAVDSVDYVGMKTYVVGDDSHSRPPAAADLTAGEMAAANAADAVAASDCA